MKLQCNAIISQLRLRFEDPNGQKIDTCIANLSFKNEFDSMVKKSEIVILPKEIGLR